MDVAFLGGRGEAGGSGIPRGDGKRFNRRLDAIAYGSTYQKAAALVDIVRFLSY